MFEDHAYDAFEFLNQNREQHKQNLQAEADKSDKPKRRQVYDIGVHKAKHTLETVKKDVYTSGESGIELNNLACGKDPFCGAVKLNVNHDITSPIVSGVVLNMPLVKELEKKGLLPNSGEKMQTDKGHSKKEYFDNETKKLLDDAVKDFIENSGTNYLSYGKSNTKKEGKTNLRKNPLLDGKFTRLFPDQYEINKNEDIKTLGDSLSYFGLSSDFQGLEKSLEDLRRNRIDKEDHEKYFRQFDKEIQKLSFKYHPDKVKSRDGTEEDITRAQNLQTALNATRTALKLLNSAFVEDIGTEHKFGFYTKLSITSLCNEDEMKSHIYEVIFKISMISRIKQQNIISEIRKFLIESKNCVNSYLGHPHDFEKYRDLALLHLKYCIKGLKKLCAELEEVKDQCISEKNGENIHCLLQSMARESKRDLKILKNLKKAAKASLKGNYIFFSPEAVMDPYFVLPFVSYTNIMLMCNVMVRNSSILDYLNSHEHFKPHDNDELRYLMHPYYLASYCSGSKLHERTVYTIMGKEIPIEKGSKIRISKVEIELEFYKCIEAISSFIEYKFKVEDYYEAPTTNLLAVDLEKCLTLMTEFQDKQEEVSKGIKEFQKKVEKMDEKYEKFDKMMETAEELNRKVKERLEQSKKFSEKIIKSVSNQQ